MILILALATLLATLIIFFIVSIFGPMRISAILTAAIILAIILSISSMFNLTVFYFSERI